MRKQILEKRQQRLEAKKADLKARAAASQDVAEVRSIQTQIEELEQDLAEVREELEAIEAIEAETRDAAPAGERVNGDIANLAHVATYRQAQPQEETEVRSSMEYRKAFMAYMTKGTPMPAEFRNGDAINTGDTGAAIPMTIVNDVINTIRKRYGNLYASKRRSSPRAFQA